MASPGAAGCLFMRSMASHGSPIDDNAALPHLPDVGPPGSGSGRPPEDRRALARAFLAKALWDSMSLRG